MIIDSERYGFCMDGKYTKAFEEQQRTRERVKSGSQYNCKNCKIYYLCKSKTTKSNLEAYSGKDLFLSKEVKIYRRIKHANG